MQVGDQDAFKRWWVAVLLRVELPHRAFAAVDEESLRAPPQVHGAGAARASGLARSGAQEGEVAGPTRL